MCRPTWVESVDKKSLNLWNSFDSQIPRHEDYFSSKSLKSVWARNLASSWTVSGSSKSQSKEGAIGYFISKIISLLCKGIKGEFRNYRTDASKVTPNFDLKYFWNLGWDFNRIWANFWNFVNRSKTCFNRDKTYFSRLSFCFWKASILFSEGLKLFSIGPILFLIGLKWFSVGLISFLIGLKWFSIGPILFSKGLKSFSIGPILFSVMQ